MDTWYAFIDGNDVIDSFLSGDEVHADIVRRYAPTGWRLEPVDSQELAARLEACMEDDIDGVPISNLYEEATLSSGCGLN